MAKYLRVDLIDLIELDQEISLPMSDPDCTWDEAGQCFWIEPSSTWATWLRLYGVING